jgi:transposase
MDHYAGIDVSLELSSVCIVDVQGRILKEAKVASDPDALGAFFGILAFRWRGSGLKPDRCRSGFMPD